MGRIASSHHLFRPSSLYHFRLVVPPELRRIVGQREIRYSLRTGQLSRAKYLALQMNGFVQKLFQNLRGNVVMKTLTEIDIKTILDKFYLDMLQQDETARTLALPKAENAQEESQRLRQAKEGLRKALADCAHGNFPVSANLLLQESGFQCDQTTDLFKQFCREMLKAAMKVTEVLEMRTEGNYSYEEPAGLVSPTPEPHEPPSRLLSELIQLFLEDKESAGKWEPKTREEYAACLNLLKEVIGDVPVRTITYDVMKDFRDQIRKLPANMNKKPRYRDKTVPEILKMAVDDPMSITNVNKYLVRASTCFNFAVKHDFMSKNPAEGLQIKQSKRADELRERCTDEDLRRLFGSEEYIEDNHRHSYYFWLPVLALYIGCRLNELCQLYLDDIKQIDGVWVIDVNEEGEGKRVKTKAGRRAVPIHPFLLDDLKFVRYVGLLRAQGRKRLFPELPPMRDGYGQTASKWFGRYRERCGILGKGKDFHSFRHTFIDSLKQTPGVDHTMLSEVVGHEIESITLGRYGKKYSPKILLEHVFGKLNYHVDLSHLKRSRFVLGTS